MQSRLDEFTKANSVILAVAADKVEDNAKLVERENLKITILADPELSVIDDYGLRHKGASIDGGDISRPAIFIIDGKGIIRHSFFPDNWRVRARAEELLAELKKL